MTNRAIFNLTGTVDRPRLVLAARERPLLSTRVVAFYLDPENRFLFQFVSDLIIVVSVATDMRFGSVAVRGGKRGGRISHIVHVLSHQDPLVFVAITSTAFVFRIMAWIDPDRHVITFHQTRLEPRADPTDPDTCIDVRRLSGGVCGWCFGCTDEEVVAFNLVDGHTVSLRSCNVRDVAFNPFTQTLAVSHADPELIVEFVRIRIPLKISF